MARIKKQPVLGALVGASKYPELTQGSSGNDNWHSWLKQTIPVLAFERSHTGQSIWDHQCRKRF